MNIRKAEHRDLEEALILGWEMHQESRYKSMDFNLEKVAQFFQMAMFSNEYLFLVAEKNSRVVGGFIGYAMPHWCSDDLVAGDFALYVAPEFRGTTTAFRMIRRYVKWAKDKGVSEEFIGLGITTGVHTDATQRLYEKSGFELTGLTMNFRGAA